MDKDKDMEISSQETKNFQQFNLKGLLTFETSNNVEKYITEKFTYKHKNILIDMNEVEYLNSAALCTLYRIFRNLSEQKVNIFISNPNTQITQLFSITGVDRYFSYLDEKDLLQQ